MMKQITCKICGLKYWPTLFKGKPIMKSPPCPATNVNKLKYLSVSELWRTRAEKHYPEYLEANDG